MSKITKEELINSLKEMTLIEINDLVKALEEEFGVSALAMVSGGGEKADAGSAEEEKSEFTLMLKTAGAKKIQVIKIVREITGLGLKEAKELVDNGGKVMEGLPKEKANSFKTQLEESGATVELV